MLDCYACWASGKCTVKPPLHRSWRGWRLQTMNRVNGTTILLRRGLCTRVPIIATRCVQIAMAPFHGILEYNTDSAVWLNTAIWKRCIQIASRRRPSWAYVISINSTLLVLLNAVRRVTVAMAPTAEVHRPLRRRIVVPLTLIIYKSVHRLY